MVTLYLDKGSAEVLVHTDDPYAAKLLFGADGGGDACEIRDYRGSDLRQHLEPALKVLCEHEVEFQLICREDEDHYELGFSVSCQPRGDKRTRSRR